MIKFGNIPMILIILSIISYCNLGLIINLITIIYPIIKIQSLLKNNFYNDIINSKRKRITIEEINFLKESTFWLKYWCLFSIWMIIENFLFYIPLMIYLKLLIFLKIMINHNFTKIKSHLEIYDKLEEYLNENRLIEIDKINDYIDFINKKINNYQKKIV